MRPRQATRYSRGGGGGDTDGCFAVATRDKSSRHWRNDFDGSAITGERHRASGKTEEEEEGEGRRWRETWHKEVVNRNPLARLFCTAEIYIAVQR